MTTTPVVALQKPKDISVEEIESELRDMWRSQNAGTTAPVATRATTFSIVVYEPEEFQQLLAALGFYKGAIDGIHSTQTRDAIRQAQIAYDLRVTGRVGEHTLARLREEYAKLPEQHKVVSNPDIRGFNLSEAISAYNPCRVITLCPVLGEDEGVTAQVSAYCPVQKRNASNLICCEYITLTGTKAALERVAGTVSSLMIGDLPKFAWWKATPNPEQLLFQQLADTSNCLIVDSSYFSDAESELKKIQAITTEADKYIADLNWHRLSPWQELTAEAFDPPERRDSLEDIDYISIDHERGNAAQAIMFMAWFASRLGWTPTRYVDEGGDYGIRKIYFESSDGKEIEGELAAIPVADLGEVIGDLIGIRLASSNQAANCCTILCSESTGCMRMEAGGGAQACRVEEVSAISDQRADLILGQQLQRWGEDVLYQESLAMADQILHLCPQNRNPNR